LSGTDRLASLGGTFGRGGIPPTPPFRRALALKAAAIQISLHEIRHRKFRKRNEIHIWDYTSILRRGAIVANLLI